MYINIPELLRKEAVQSLFATNTFNNSWIIWKPEIQRILGENFDENALLNLGDYLTQILRTTGTTGTTGTAGTAGRGQG